MYRARDLGRALRIAVVLGAIVPGAGFAVAATVTRGPYLQRGTPASVVVRWRTDVPSDSRVQYGLEANALGSAAQEFTPTTEHVIELTGLGPDTRYYYAVGSSTELLAGGDAEHFFDTAPVPGTPKPTRIWVLGDSGTADPSAMAVRDAYLAFAAGRHTDLWLMLGDNAYPLGTDAEYQAAVFDMYPSVLRSSVLWPTLGNHDGYSASSATQTGPYYDIFTLPTAGEAGGVPSGTEAYYSFDYGDVHCVVLDSFGTDRSPGSPMLSWLAADLAATSRSWLVAFWHHPPYSKGSHDSDNTTVDRELVDMRENALPILEQAGVDLVLAGHSHSYERSFLIDGTYATPTPDFATLLAGGHIVDAGDGRTSGTGPYRKAEGPHEGAVYVVAGSSGSLSPGSLNHPVMYASLYQLGSVVLDIDGNILDARFLNDAGAVSDSFRIVKPACDDDGTCELGEDCNICPGDCGSLPAPVCGNQFCEAGDGEDCLSCPADCNGRQSGSSHNRFCCGDGAGQNPLPCSAPVCTSSGFQCTSVPSSPGCCGDGTCSTVEVGCSCVLDCGVAVTTENPASLCRDGLDNDCDGVADCGDPDCSSVSFPSGASCTSDAQCCSGRCRVRAGQRVCQ